MLVGRQPLGRLHQPGQQRRLAHVDVGDGLAEEVARGLFHAVAAVPEIHLVEVDGQHVFLGKTLRQPARQDDLLHLAPHALFRREQELLDHLLGDGRGALGELAPDHVFDEGAHHALVVDALVLEVLGVLGGQQRLDHDLGDLRVGHHGAMGGADLADELAVAVEHLDDLLRAVVADAAQAGHGGIVAVVIEDTDQSARARDHRKQQDDRPRRRGAEATGVCRFLLAPGRFAVVFPGHGGYFSSASGSGSGSGFAVILRTQSVHCFSVMVISDLVEHQRGRDGGGVFLVVQSAAFVHLVQDSVHVAFPLRGSDPWQYCT
jgi:hypothetical protein